MIKMKSTVTITLSLLSEAFICTNDMYLLLLRSPDTFVHRFVHTTTSAFCFLCLSLAPFIRPTSKYDSGKRLSSSPHEMHVQEFISCSINDETRAPKTNIYVDNNCSVIIMLK